MDGFASGAGGGDGSAGSAEGVAPRSSGAAAQSPAQSLVPRTYEFAAHCCPRLYLRLRLATNLGRPGLSEGRRRKANDRGKDQQSPHRHFPFAFSPGKVNSVDPDLRSVIPRQ
jgi:hypothetical protein